MNTHKHNSESTMLFITFGSLYPRIVKIAEQSHLSASGVVQCRSRSRFQPMKPHRWEIQAAADGLYPES